MGYGDRFPFTDLGRIGGAIIIVIGVGVFGTFTGYLANLFLGSKPAEEEADTEVAAPELSSAVQAADAVVTRPSDAELLALAEAAEATFVALRKLLDSKQAERRTKPRPPDRDYAASASEPKTQRYRAGRRRRLSAMKSNDKRPIIQSSGYNGSEPTRVCPNCGLEKPLTAFGFRDMGDGNIRNQSWCADCR